MPSLRATCEMNELLCWPQNAIIIAVTALAFTVFYFQK